MAKKIIKGTGTGISKKGLPVSGIKKEIKTTKFKRKLADKWGHIKKKSPYKYEKPINWTIHKHPKPY